MIKVMTDAYNGKKSRVISALYQALLKSRRNSTMYIKEKWEKDLGIELTEEEWHNLCWVQHSTTGSRVWREFGWKNVIRYNTTQQLEHNLCCRQCGQMGADHMCKVPKDKRVLGRNMGA